MRTRSTIHAILLTSTLVACGSKTETGSAGSAAGSVGSAKPMPVMPKASEGPLPSMPALELAADDKRDAKVTLGHALFFDKRLSGKADRACYSCHQNEDGNGGHDPLAIGSGDKVLTRHAPVIWNVGYWKNALYWDGRAKDLVANAKGAWGGGNMGGGDDAALEKKAAELAAIAGYKPMFEAAFGKTEIKAQHVEEALAEYERTLVCKDTAYDKFAGGDKAALSEPQKKGLDLFMGKAACNTCHAPPFFSTAMGVEGGIYFNIGIGTKGVEEAKVDVGRMKISNNPDEWAAFKPPSLRNVTKSAPYFHDGSVAKLEDAVRLMAGGGIDNKAKSGALVNRQLSDAEIADLIAFLGAIECGGKLDEPKLP
ncbi:MAG: c-type cytochrome [Proteobacteria bacterium]|nr:c-type cytochrome [Pseudomonadota bacterium]